jgi:hypothetical protein
MGMVTVPPRELVGGSITISQKMDTVGIEPTTSCMRNKRSTPELCAQLRSYQESSKRVSFTTNFNTIREN